MLKRCISCFKKEGDKFIKNIHLPNDLSIEEIKNIITHDKNDFDLICCYKITEELAEYLNKYLSEKINIRKYDFFIETYIDE